MKIATIYPNNYFFPDKTVQSFLKVAPYYSIIQVQSHSVPDNRNRIWEKRDDDLLFIDADMTFELEDVRKIEEHLKTYDIITGLYLLPNESPAILKRGEKDYEFINPQKGIFEIDACGAGFLGISKRVSLPPNPFSNIWEGALIHGEDVSFCHRAKEAGIKIWCDSDIKLGHVRIRVYKPE